MLEKIQSTRPMQLGLGFVLGVCFGFLLQRGGVTRYDVIMGQLLLTDWTVVKIILTAILTGMVGVYFLRMQGLAQLHRKSGSVGSTVIGGLIFGVGFAVLGYCPGTLVGAAAQGSLDALGGGAVGMLAGAGIYAALYPRLSRSVLHLGDFGQVTWPEVLKRSPWSVIALVAVVAVVFFGILESTGL